MCSILNGIAQPVFGYLFAGFLSDLLISEREGHKNGFPIDDIKMKIYLMCGLAVLSFLFSVSSKLSLGKLTHNVTQGLRRALYRSIMVKHMGWFDLHDADEVADALSRQTAIANGACMEMVGTYAESLASVVAGLAIGFYFSKEEAFACLALAPFFIAAQRFEINFQRGISEE